MRIIKHLVQQKEKNICQRKSGKKCELKHKQARQPSTTNVRGLLRKSVKNEQ